MNFAQKFFLVAALSISCLSNASANLIKNGDFESGRLSGWTLFKSTNGLTNSSVRKGPDGTMSARFNVGQVNHSVSKAKSIGGGIRQNFTSIEGIIDIHADIAVQATSKNKEGGIFSLYLDHVLVDSFQFGAMLESQTRSSLLSYTGEIDAGVHELRFLITRPWEALSYTPRQYIDNVLVTVAAVPEPGSLALLGLGASGLAFMRRRKAGAVQA